MPFFSLKNHLPAREDFRYFEVILPKILHYGKILPILGSFCPFSYRTGRFLLFWAHFAQNLTLREDFAYFGVILPVFLPYGKILAVLGTFCPKSYITGRLLLKKEKISANLPEREDKMTTISEVQHFGAFIRRARKQQSMTQRQLAAITGVSPRFIGELERGKPTIEMGRAFRVAWMLGLAIEMKGGEAR